MIAHFSRIFCQNLRYSIDKFSKWAYNSIIMSNKGLKIKDTQEALLRAAWQRLTVRDKRLVTVVAKGIVAKIDSVGQISKLPDGFKSRNKNNVCR
jgi:hypothetical protein